jgi:hypothetical protein
MSTKTLQTLLDQAHALLTALATVDLLEPDPWDPESRALTPWQRHQLACLAEDCLGRAQQELVRLRQARRSPQVLSTPDTADH